MVKRIGKEKKNMQGKRFGETKGGRQIGSIRGKEKNGEMNREREKKYIGKENR